jgi:hypothetical protein
LAKAHGDRNGVEGFVPRPVDEGKESASLVWRQWDDLGVANPRRLDEASDVPRDQAPSLGMPK